MTPITKEALYAHGFVDVTFSPEWYRKYDHPFYWTYKSGYMYMNYDSRIDDSGEYDEMQIPNCKSMEDLRDLMRLFS